jgi:hypothetical protein
MLDLKANNAVATMLLQSFATEDYVTLQSESFISFRMKEELWEELTTRYEVPEGICN